MIMLASAATAAEIAASLDYSRFEKQGRWTPVPIARNFPRLAIGTMQLRGDEDQKWIATHATDAFEPPWSVKVMAFTKVFFPRFDAEDDAIDAEIEVILNRFTCEMRRPDSPCELRPLQWAVEAVKAFGGRRAFARFLKEEDGLGPSVLALSQEPRFKTQDQKRSIPKMNTITNAFRGPVPPRPGKRLKNGRGGSCESAAAELRAASEKKNGKPAVTALVPAGNGRRGMFARGIETGVVIVEPPGGDLSTAEKKRLGLCEKVIEQNLHGWIELGAALATIRNERLYRESHATFEAYCQERFEFTRSYAYRLIDACDVVKDLSPNGDSGVIAAKALPRTESQARALAKIKSPERRRAVWDQIVSAARQSPITAQVIEAKIAEVIGETRKSPESPNGSERKNGQRSANPTGQKPANEWGTQTYGRELAALEKEISRFFRAWPMQRDETVNKLRTIARGRMKSA